VKIIVRFAILYLAALIFFGWGMAVARYEIFPFSYIKFVKDDVTKFVRGDVVDEHTTLFQKALNDLGIRPERLIIKFAASNSKRFRKVELDGIRKRRDLPRIWMSPSAPNNYRLIVGAFDFEKALWGAILLDPAGRIVHRWYMNGEIKGLTKVPDTLKILYGVNFFPDGSAAFVFEKGFYMDELSGGIIKVDYCSQVQWTKAGMYHHVVQPTEDYSAFWAFEGNQGDLDPILILIDAKTGDTIKKIDMADVEKANPETMIFDLRRRVDGKHDNATHPNDIDPLPTVFADAYPQFSAGDLLLSYNNTNLIFVVDPKTLKIKWWYLGAGDGQHDPDWHPDGTISIFDNNLRANRRGMPAYSKIVSINPSTNTHRTIIYGKPFNFYSIINGHHQFTNDGTVIITSTMQGRVFEVNLETGKIVFEFVNAYDWSKSRTLYLSDTFIIDKNTAERWLKNDCPQ